MGILCCCWRHEDVVEATRDEERLRVKGNYASPKERTENETKIERQADTRHVNEVD